MSTAAQTRHDGNGKAVTAELLDRTPPTDLDAERGFLACVLVRPSILNEAHELRAADFRDERHQIIVGAMLGMQARGIPIDITLLVGVLKDSGRLEEVGGFSYLLDVAQAAPIAVNWRHYLARVRSCAEARGMIVMLTGALRDTYNGNPMENIKRRIGVSLESVARADPFRFERLSCAELDSVEYHTEYLIEWTLVTGQPCIFAGAKKCLKTTILVALALSLATGFDFLGSLRVLRCARVMVMSGESGIATLQETARRIALSMGTTLAEIDGLFWCDKLPQFTNLEHLVALEDLLRSDEIEVLIIDPAYLCMPGDDAGNLFKQGEILRAMNDVCQRNGVTLLIAHHTKKNIADPFQPPELESISWSGFQEWARQWLLVGRREKYEPGTGSHRLWLNVGGSAGHSSLWALDIKEGKLPHRTWDVRVMRGEEAREEVQERVEATKQAKVDEKVQRVKDRIVKAMGKYPNGETGRTIRALAGTGGGELTRLAFDALVDAGNIVPCEVQRACRKTPYPGFKLADRPDK